MNKFKNWPKCITCSKLVNPKEILETGECEQCCIEREENEHDEYRCDCPCHEKAQPAMRTRKAVIKWISKQRRRFAIEIQVKTTGAKANPYGVAVELPIDLLSEGMREGQQVTIQVDDGDRDMDT